MASFLLQRWMSALPWTEHLLASLGFSTAWVLLHLLVPMLASRVLDDETCSQTQRGVVRILLSLFPPHAPAKGDEGEPDDGKRAGGRRMDGRVDERTCSVEDHKKTDCGSGVGIERNTWRRARAASFMVVSTHSIKRRIRKRFNPLRAWALSDHIVSEILISIIWPLAIAGGKLDRGDGFDVLSVASSPQFIVSLLLAHRIVGPVSIAVRAVTEEVVERMNESMHGDKLALLGENHFLPNCLSFALWCMWLLVGLNSLGVNVSQIISSFGLTGVALAFAMQNYASDVVGSLTLMADQRFSTGDLVRIGENSGLLIIDRVGILSTSVHAFMGPRAKVYIPNSHIVSKIIVNESRQKDRRINLVVHVDPRTQIEKLRGLPTAIFASVKEATASFPVTFVGEDNGVSCELLGLSDDAGLRFEVGVMIAVHHADPLQYKRFLTQANLAIVSVLQDRGVLISSREKFIQTVEPRDACKHAKR